MHVLHVSPYMHPSAGGPPVVVENFVRQTIKRGHSSEIISTSILCEGDEASLLQKLNALAPTKFLPPSKAFFLTYENRNLIGQSIRQADIVHVHTLWHPINLVVRQECLRHKRPYVVMPHGMLDPYSLSVKSWRKRLYLLAIERANLVSASRCMFTTAEEAWLASTQISSLPPSVLVPLGGDAPEIDNVELAKRFFVRFPRARNRLQILYLGRLHYKKGLDRLLSALPSIVNVLPDALLTIVGDGTSEYTASLMESIRSRGLDDFVLLTGRLEGELKWGAYASAAIFVLPSRQENFAITVAEAMQMGVPVIVSDKVNTWPHVEEALGGLVIREEQIDLELAPSVISLLRDREIRTQMGQSGRRYARSTLTWEKAGDRLLECYRELLDSLKSSYSSGAVEP